MLKEKSKVWKTVVLAFIFLSPSVHAQQINSIKSALFLNKTDGSQVLLNHVPPEVIKSQAVKINRVNAAQILNLGIVLPSKNQAGLDSFLKDLYNPKSPGFHKFITPQQFDDLYGASSIDTALVIEHLQSKGFKIGKQSKSGFLISVKASVAQIQSAFNVTINNYQRANGSVFFAPDSNPTIPPQIAGKVVGIVGMDNTLKIRPHYHRGNKLVIKNGKSMTAAVAIPTVKHASPEPTMMSEVIKTIGDTLLKANGSTTYIPPPLPVTGLTAVPSANSVVLYWNQSPSAVTSSTITYNVYGTSASGTKQFALIGNVTPTNFIDSSATDVALSCPKPCGLTNGTIYSYFVTALDTSTNEESTVSAMASATPYAFLGIGGALMGPADISDAYNLNSLASTGGGQILGIYELDGYNPTDITTFENYYNISPVPLANVYADSYNGTPGLGIDEVDLDIEIATAVAPGLSSIRVYEAPSPGISYPYSWVDNWESIIDDVANDIANGLPYPNIISCSWGGDELSSYTSYNHNVFSELASIGITVFASSGDSGAYANCDNGTNPPNCTINGIPASSSDPAVLSVGDPASDQYVTGVGISFLTPIISSGVSTGVYYKEQASLFSGGGISGNYVPMPSWQLSAATDYYDRATYTFGSTTWRNVPDVAFTADPSTPYGIYITDPTDGAGWYGVWGSSAAAPIWAAYMSRVNQGRIAAGKTPVGFVNPLLYQLFTFNQPACRSVFASCDYHSIPTGINDNYANYSGNDYYPADPGYDVITGLGSFNGMNLYDDLVGVTLTATAGNGDVQLSWTPSASAAYYNIYRGDFSGGENLLVPMATSTTTSYTNTGLTAGQSYYYIVAPVNSLGVEGINSIEAHASPFSLATILTQPISRTVIAPSVATFTVVVGGSSTVNYQWMDSVNGGAYVNVSGGSGANTASYTTPATSAANNGTLYQCVVSNLAGSVTSNAASLTVDYAPLIENQPGNQSVNVPVPATFTVVAIGNPALTYQWMDSVNGGAYVNVTGGSGAATASYTTPATVLANSGTLYECVLSNGIGASVTTIPATLTVSNQPVIGTNPLSETVTAPATATFSVVVTAGLPVTYQWMDSVNGGAYVNVSGGSGANSATYTTPATTAANNGTLYKCVVTNASGNATSSAATLTVNAAPLILNQPSNETVVVPTPATFTVVATGLPTPSYQWKESVNGGAYVNVIGGSGGTSASYTTPATAIVNTGTLYKCVITNSLGSVTSNAASLTVNGNGSVLSPTALSASDIVLRIGVQQDLVGIILTWAQSKSPGIVKNSIYRSAGAGPYILLATINATTSYKDKSMAKNVTYQYKVSAINTSGAESIPSSSVSLNY